jgi:thiamine pyrophosphate-dependent acetolactate synthase large subunit-like protein
VHLINGLYNAKRDHAPVLALTGQVPRKEMAGPYFQETNQQKLFDDVCVFNETLYSKEQLPRLLHQAIKAAIVQRGVAHLALPTDVTFETIEVSQHSIDKEMQRMPVLPREDSLKEAADLINQAKKPTLLVGCGCRGARSEVRQLAKRLQAPVVHSLKGTEILEYDDPYSIGGVGHVGTPHGMRALEKCDLLIMLGTDFPYPAFLPDHGNIIQINVNALHLGRRCPIKLGIEGDVQLTLPKLIPQLD